MVEHTEANVQELADTLDEWQGKTDHLKSMASQVSDAASSRYDETVRRMREILKDVRQMLSRSTAMAPEEWIDARTEILLGFRELQILYNAAMADWPQE